MAGNNNGGALSNGLASAPSPASIGALATSNDLSELAASASTARSNLGVGAAGTLPFATITVPFTAPHAAGTDVLAGPIASNAGTYTGPFTLPPTPRVVQGVFPPLWDGGDVTLHGIDQYGTAGRSDVLASPGAGGGTVQGLVVFSALTNAELGAVGAGVLTLSLQGGIALGLGPTPVAPGTDFCIVFPNGSSVEADGVDATHGTVTLTTAPNGSNNYAVLVNVT
jgi:hypothetical protein